MILPAIFVGALFLVVFFRQTSGPTGPNELVFTGRTMGTSFTVKIVVPPAAVVDEDEVSSAIRDTVDDVDSRMSTYRADSELSRFNDSGSDPFAVSPALFDVLTEAARVAELSGGAFDITVGPLVEAWGFGPGPVTEIPDETTIQRLLETHGATRLELDADALTVRKDNPDIRCDLSAIAKGYAVDRVAMRLGELGFADFMVEIGGEVRAAGRNAAGTAWRIGVERPDGEGGRPWAAVALEDAAMATSGDYRNFYERDGVRISHTIDPRTGRPITHALASVSVIHPSCMTADALATALDVLGPEAGRELVDREGLAALFIVRGGDGGFDEWASADWPVENTVGGVDVAPGESR